MQVVLRLKRMGGKKDAFFRIVAAAKADKRDGKVIEELGHYDPKKAEGGVTLKKERIVHWLKNGATPSLTVKSFIKKMEIGGNTD